VDLQIDPESNSVRFPRHQETVIFAPPPTDAEDAEAYRALLLDFARELDLDASVTWHVIAAAESSQSERILAPGGKP
jgi:hypothetical protein